MSQQNNRVPMMWNEADVVATAGPRIGEEFSVRVVVDEGRWRDERFCAGVLEEAVREAIAGLMRHDSNIIEQRVRELLLSREFVEPIVAEAIRNCAVAFAADFFKAEIELRQRAGVWPAPGGSGDKSTRS